MDSLYVDEAISVFTYMKFDKLSYVYSLLQLFKGTFFYCEGENLKNVTTKDDCLAIPGNIWLNRKYNFDDLGQALMSLFVLSSKDGWVNIMYTGLDAVGVDLQVRRSILMYK